MTAQHNLDGDETARLMFLGLDTRAAEALAAFWPHTKAALPSILEVFYTKAAAIPGLAKLAGGRIDHLKLAQTTHWERLLSGRFDARYFESARTIGLTHARIGLEPRWYVGGYNLVLAHLLDLAATKHRWSGAKLSVLRHALTAAVLLDIDIALSTYQDQLTKQATE